MDGPSNYREDLFEGDIMGIPKHAHRQKRQAVKGNFKTWPEATVPYQISNKFKGEARELIEQAIEEVMMKTCIRLVEKTAKDKDFVVFDKKDGCWSMIGSVGGKQRISIDSHCESKGVIIHELLHTLGIFHEQARPDRDQHVEVLWENVSDGNEDQFNKFTYAQMETYETAYDFGSVMHYGAFSFSANGRPTLAVKDGQGADVQIGQREGMSETDALRVNKLYHCQEEIGDGNNIESSEEEVRERVMEARKVLILDEARKLETTPLPYAHLARFSKLNFRSHRTTEKPREKSSITGCYDMMSSCKILTLSNRKLICEGPKSRFCTKSCKLC